ncbi:PD-(D/E)XK nuclease superfamily protein [Bacteroides luti]|uniref:PD-(D/E)XK nuclease superfamily protein n=1 Tax=Bacteroides luti TaxID=1297750 RepID=A0A1M4SFA8_9BACE|nr:PD-(D/E)XK nuclease family protein [Bacteroides luti]SHE30913.1 PD-(D/E)XK nuclease superfamily protein [Bacteroides luti]
MVNTKEVDRLLNNVKKLFDHKKKIEKLKGETFNVFSILKMERMENNTHSAFIKELLDPKGTHLKDGIFLKLFLECIENSDLDVTTAKVELEKHIGTRDDKNKTGGRIDIFISDAKGNYVSIENKIDAQDQNVQIERYCNYKKGENKVYYLTLDGKSPDKTSCGKLEAGTNYYLLSYKNHILKWLELCLEKSVDDPILRESIKQYAILIKKITYTMNNEEEKELIDIMLKHYEESSYISSNFNKAKQAITEKFRIDVYNELTKKLKDKYVIVKGFNTSKPNSQIWIKPTQTLESYLYFGIEGFSGEGHFNGQLFIGTFNKKAPDKSSYADVEGNESFSNWWINVRQFENNENYILNMSNPETITYIMNEKNREGLVDYMMKQVEQYLKEQTPLLVDFINKNKIV